MVNVKEPVLPWHKQAFEFGGFLVRYYIIKCKQRCILYMSLQMRQSETPDQRMLRPCRCSGSVSYVHLECLNRWRATSTAAYFTCSVCKYNYRIERTLIAQILVHEATVLVLAVLMIVAACFALGLVVSFTIAYLELPIDPVHDILVLMNIDRYWLRCILSSKYSALHGTPHSAGSDFFGALQHIYATSPGVVELGRNLIALWRSPLPMVYFLCHPVMSSTVNVFLLGAMPVGAVGFFGYFIGKQCSLLLLLFDFFS